MVAERPAAGFDGSFWQQVAVGRCRGRRGLNQKEEKRITASVGRRVELLPADGYLAVAAGRFQG